MRSLRFTAVAVIVSCAAVLAGCGGDDPEPAANDTTPSVEESMTPDEEESSTPEETEEADPGDIDDFPDVDGFTYADLPGTAFKSLNASLKGTPQIEGVAAKLVEKDGEEAGLVMRMAIDPEAAGMAGFEDGFLPGFAGGIAGSNADPDYEAINGTNVVIIETPDQTGTAYAWLEGSVATILVFMALPIAITTVYSVLTPAQYGGVVWEASAEAYIRLLFERDIFEARWEGGQEGLLEFWIRGDSFMRQQNRALVGTMLQVASGRRPLDNFTDLLTGAQREDAGPTAPAQGLHLHSVSYAAT